MEPKSRLSQEEIRGTLVDLAAIPILLFWALLSLGPVAGLMQGGEALRMALNVFFFATGLYGVLSGAVLLKALMWSHRRFESGLGLKRVWLAGYGAVWCILYLVFVMTPR
jgi:hypothetical protein